MEISEEMGLSVGAVKARLFQGRKRLRKELEDMAPETTMPMETPETLNIEVLGSCENQHDPLHPLRQTDNLLAKRLLYFCRKGAKSVEHGAVTRYWGRLQRKERDCLRRGYLIFKFQIIPDRFRPDSL